MIQLSKQDYMDWKVSDPTKHLIEYLEELRFDIIEGIGTGKFDTDKELQKAIGNYQILRIVLDYIMRDFQYYTVEEKEDDKGSGV